MKTIEQFWNEITENKQLGEKLIKTTNEQELEAILEENEVDCTKEQFNEFVLEMVNKAASFPTKSLKGFQEVQLL